MEVHSHEKTINFIIPFMFCRHNTGKSYPFVVWTGKVLFFISFWPIWHSCGHYIRLNLYAPTIVTSRHWMQEHQDNLLSEEIADAHNRYDTLMQDDKKLSEYNSKLTEEWTTSASNLRRVCNNLQNEQAIIRSFLNDYDHAVKSYAKTSKREDYIRKLRQNLRDEVRTTRKQHDILTNKYDNIFSLQSSLTQAKLNTYKEIIKTRAELDTIFSKKDINFPDEIKNVETIASYNAHKKSRTTVSASRLNRIKRKLNVGDAIL
jgi:chromosome segregation ATPase